MTIKRLVALLLDHLSIVWAFRLPSNKKIAIQASSIQIPLYTFSDKKSPGMADLEAKAWSKDQLIWQIIGTSRWDLREKEAMKKFSNFIFYENDVGNISRQELVSMVPVLLLVTTVSIWIVNTVTIQKPDFRIPDSCKNWTSEYRIYPKSRVLCLVYEW